MKKDIQRSVLDINRFDIHACPLFWLCFFTKWRVKLYVQLIEIQIESHAPPSWEEFQLTWPPADTVGEASRSELPGTMWQEEILGD